MKRLLSYAFLFLLVTFFMGGQPVSAGPVSSHEYPFKITTAQGAGHRLWQGEYGRMYCDVRLPLQNVSDKTLTVQDIYLNLTQDAPFEIFHMRYTASLNPSNGVVEAQKNLAAGFANPFLVRQEVKAGYHPLNFTIVYKEEGDPQPKSQVISYLVYFHEKPEEKKPDSRTLLEVADMPVAEGVYGHAMPVSFAFVNRGFSVVDVISVSPVVASSTDSFPFEIQRTDYSFPIDRQLWPISANQQPNVAQSTLIKVDLGQMQVRQDITSGYKPISFVIKYKQGSQEIQEATLKVFVKIQGNPKNDGKEEAGGKTPVPRLMAQGYSTVPERINGGDPFTLKLRIKNTSTHTAVQNIRASFTSSPASTDAGVPFMTASGAASVFIPSIGADSEYLLEVAMQSSVKVPQRSYPLNIRLEYEDMKANPISSEESITIQIYQEVRLELGAIQVTPSELQVGDEANLMFPIYNKGKSRLYNVSALIPAEQGVSANEVYLGNLDPGATGQVDMMVKTAEASVGKSKFQVQIRYEDENGKPSTLDASFPLTPMPAKEEKAETAFPGMEGIEQMSEEDLGPMDTGQAKWRWIALAGGSFLLLIILLSMARKRKKKKEEAMEDDAFFQDIEQS